MKKIAAGQIQPVHKSIPSMAPAVYRAHRAAARIDPDVPPPLDPADAPWPDLPVAAVSHFHPDSAPDHRPVTEVRLLHDGLRLRALFDVRDRYVRCVHDRFQSMVSRDSCVEMFLQPPGCAGYLNFEFSCGGALLVYFIEDPRRGTHSLFSKYVPLPKRLGRQVRVWSSLQYPIDPELTRPVRWQLACEIPVSVISPYTSGRLNDFAGSWRGNFFKCADGTSRPHWAAWNAIGPVCRFHQPDRFGTIVFED